MDLIIKVIEFAILLAIRSHYLRKIMKKSLLISPFIVALLFFQGCSIKSISHGSEITDQQIAQIEDGKTTKGDIFVQFGNPSKVMDGEKAFFYSWTRGSKNSFLGIGSGTA
jgi:hypothetical protein